MIFNSRNSGKYKRGQSIQKNRDSQTVPDMSYTIRELLDRYTTLPTDISQHEGVYSESPDFNDAIPTDIDLTDISNNARKISELQSEISRLKTETESLATAKKQQGEKKQKDSDKLKESDEGGTT